MNRMQIPCCRLFVFSMYVALCMDLHNLVYNAGTRACTQRMVAYLLTCLLGVVCFDESYHVMSS